jgi:hypothetical protein
MHLHHGALDGQGERIACAWHGDATGANLVENPVLPRRFEFHSAIGVLCGAEDKTVRSALLVIDFFELLWIVVTGSTRKTVIVVKANCAIYGVIGAACKQNDQHRTRGD